jgi:hypothetical protein
MDIYDFGSRFAPGFTLNVEERAALEVQMAKRQAEERLHRWVRVRTESEDDDGRVESRAVEGLQGGGQRNPRLPA